jgi:hypothetical protein
MINPFATEEGRKTLRDIREGGVCLLPQHGTRHPFSQPMVGARSPAASASLVGAMVASHHRRKFTAVAGTGLYMALILAQWKLWADRFTRESGPTSA